jgi:guanylate kinase
MNELKHLAEFRSILEDYKLSEHAVRVLRQTKLVLLVGPTSAGRNTIINKLLKTDAYHYIVSDTTRQPRVNNGVPEQDGREYWFRSEAEILDDLGRGEFLEAAVIHNQQVSGISMRELEKAQAADKIAINEVEINGADNIYHAKPDAVIVFVVPPSFSEWLERISGRGALPTDEVRRRLESALAEFSAALTHDYYVYVVNDRLEDVTADIHAIATTGEYDAAKKEHARQVVKQLYQETQKYLTSL